MGFIGNALHPDRTEKPGVDIAKRAALAYIEVSLNCAFRLSELVV